MMSQYGDFHHVGDFDLNFQETIQETIMEGEHHGEAASTNASPRSPGPPNATRALLTSAIMMNASASQEEW